MASASHILAMLTRNNRTGWTESEAYNWNSEHLLNVLLAAALADLLTVAGTAVRAAEPAARAEHEERVAHECRAWGQAAAGAFDLGSMAALGAVAQQTMAKEDVG